MSVAAPAAVDAPKETLFELLQTTEDPETLEAPALIIGPLPPIEIVFALTEMDASPVADNEDVFGALMMKPVVVPPADVELAPTDTPPAPMMVSDRAS